MQNKIITNTDKNLWKKSFHFGRICIRFGMCKTTDTSTFFVEKHKRKECQIIIQQHIFQKIRSGEKIRLAHHSRMQILKKV
jgi:hypothetical protein